MTHQALAADPLSFPYSEAPATGELREVAPGISWLRLPLPFALNHINVWVLRDDDGLTLIDTGIGSDPTKAIWTALFDGPLAGLPVLRVICTHYHPDHMGLAGWLTQRLGVPLWTTEREWEIARLWRQMSPETHRELLLKTYRDAGLDDNLGEAFIDSRTPSGSHAGHLPSTAIILDPQAPIRAGGTTWKILIGRGHSPQLAALYSTERGILISSDQVLPGISPNVSVQVHEPDSNPLQDFLDSLRAFHALPAETLVLPSHKLPFFGLQRRIDDIVAHHHTRLDLARKACVGGATAAQVMAVLFPRKFDVHQTFFAIGETRAHLNYLIGTGEVVREHRDGVDLYLGTAPCV